MKKKTWRHIIVDRNTPQPHSCFSISSKSYNIFQIKVNEFTYFLLSFLQREISVGVNTDFLIRKPPTSDKSHKSFIIDSDENGSLSSGIDPI